MVDSSKSPEGETSPGSGNMEGGHRATQSGGSFTKPDLGHNRPTLLDLSQTVVGTSSRTDPEPVSSSVLERLENMSVDSFAPRLLKHQSSHPLDQIMSDINTRVQTRSKLRNLCAFYAFYLTLSQRMFMKHL